MRSASRIFDYFLTATLVRTFNSEIRRAVALAVATM